MRAPPNHVAMMQIDCEVINTRLIHVREDAIPMHLSAQMRTAAASDSKPGNLSSGDKDSFDSKNSGNSGNETDSSSSSSSSSDSASNGGSAPFADFAYENDVYGGDSMPVDGATGSKGGKMQRASKKLYKRKRPSRNGGQGL